MTYELGLDGYVGVRQAECQEINTIGLTWAEVWVCPKSSLFG